VLVFVEEGRTKNQEKPSEQGREPTTNSTHIWHKVRIESGHIGCCPTPVPPKIPET